MSPRSDVDPQSVRAVIVELIQTEGHPAEAVASDTLTLSSLELVRLLVGLEERLDLEFDDATVMNAQFNSVNDIVHLVQQVS